MCRRYKEKANSTEAPNRLSRTKSKKLPRPHKTQSETGLPEETKLPEKEKLIPLKKATQKKLKASSEKKHTRLTEEALKKQIAELAEQI